MAEAAPVNITDSHQRYVLELDVAKTQSFRVAVFVIQTAMVRKGCGADKLFSSSGS